MAITDYASLVTAVSAWDERDHSSDIDEIIGLAESEFRIYFGPNYARETTATVTFTAGLATIPAGYLRAVAASHATGGPLTPVSMDALNRYNPLGVSGTPALYAISGTSIKTAPLLDGDLTLTYESTLTGLSASNTTNWLITNSPQAYLSMCLSIGKAKAEDFEGAALYRSQALATLNALGIQDFVSRYGHAAATIPGPTP